MYNVIIPKTAQSTSTTIKEITALGFIVQKSMVISKSFMRRIAKRVYNRRDGKD